MRRVGNGWLILTKRTANRRRLSSGSILRTPRFVTSQSFMQERARLTLLKSQDPSVHLTSCTLPDISASPRLKAELWSLHRAAGSSGLEPSVPLRFRSERNHAQYWLAVWAAAELSAASFSKPAKDRIASACRATVLDSCREPQKVEAPFPQKFLLQRSTPVKARRE